MLKAICGKVSESPPCSLLALYYTRAFQIIEILQLAWSLEDDLFIIIFQRERILPDTKKHMVNDFLSDLFSWSFDT